MTHCFVVGSNIQREYWKKMESFAGLSFVCIQNVFDIDVEHPTQQQYGI